MALEWDKVVAAARDNASPPFRFLKTFATPGAAGRWSSSWAAAGYPAPGGYAGTALAATLQDGSTVGGLNFGAVTAPVTRRLMTTTTQTVTANAVGDILLVDRLLMYPGIQHNVATAQTLNNAVTLSRFTNAVGVLAFLETTTALGATAQNVSINYTNEASVSGRTSQSQAVIASAAVGQLAHNNNLLPQGSDLGIRSVQSVTFSAANTAGVSALVLARPIASMPISVNANGVIQFDYVNQLLRIYDLPNGHCLQWLVIWSANPTNPVATLGLENFVGNLT